MAGLQGGESVRKSNVEDDEDGTGPKTQEIQEESADGDCGKRSR